MCRSAAAAARMRRAPPPTPGVGRQPLVVGRRGNAASLAVNAHHVKRGGGCRSTAGGQTWLVAAHARRWRGEEAGEFSTLTTNTTPTPLSVPHAPLPPGGLPIVQLHRLDGAEAAAKRLAERVGQPPVSGERGERGG